jgi:hypothetical protein
MPPDKDLGLNLPELSAILDAVYRAVDQSEKRLDSLRESDSNAVRLAHSDLSARLEGFPQQFATKDEMQGALAGLQRLEKDAVTREIYEANIEALRELVQKLERETLTQSTFDVFVENYRIEQERAATERRGVAEVLARATETVRAQVVEERGDFVTREYYDHEHQTIERQINLVQTWHYKMVGGLVLATFIAPLVTGLVVYFLTKGK